MLAKKLDRYDYGEEYSIDRGRYDYTKDIEQENIQIVANLEVCNNPLRRKVFFSVLLILGFAFYMVISCDVFIQKGYELTKLKNQETELRKDIEYLKVTLSKAKAPDRISSLAARIGMAPAKGNIYVGVAEGAPTALKEKNKIVTAWNK